MQLFILMNICLLCSVHLRLIPLVLFTLEVTIIHNTAYSLINFRSM